VCADDGEVATQIDHAMVHADLPAQSRRAIGGIFHDHATQVEAHAGNAEP
jgi:hypothetical protein